VRPAVVAGEDGGQAVDDSGEALGACHGHHGDRRLADVEHRVHQLHLLGREVDVRGVAALLLG
jgi:hypothetical protein